VLQDAALSGRNARKAILGVATSIAVKKNGHGQTKPKGGRV